LQVRDRADSGRAAGQLKEEDRPWITAARVKTDAIDAKTLAHLLRAGFLPEAYIAPRELRDLRELLRHRATLTRMRSAVKNRVHAILAKHGIT
jgi:transposase